MVQLLMHHVEGIALNDLDNFDEVTRDIINKSEKAKVWEAINQLGQQVMNKPDANLLNKMTQDLENHLEQELEDFDTKVSKRLTNFFLEKIKEINTKL